jgi:hypothetical protein
MKTYKTTLWTYFGLIKKHFRSALEEQLRQEKNISQQWIWLFLIGQLPLMIGPGGDS